MSKKIYFSPSDQSDNIYAVGDTDEMEQCQRISDACVLAARRCGFLAKSSNTLSMTGRINESNQWGADAHIPIHTNASDGSARGARLLCSNVNGEGCAIGTAIMAVLSAITPGEDAADDYYYQERLDLGEITSVYAPTAYLEVSFHDNPADARWIIDNTSAIAEAIVEGLCNYYNMPYIPSSADTDPEYTLYTVRSGDTLGKISVAHGLKVSEVAEYNWIKDINVIRVGQQLKIPLSGRRDYIKLFQQAINLAKIDSLDEDGIWGPLTEAAATKAIVEEGTTGTMAYMAQVMLDAYGYLSFTPDADFGPQSVAATRQYQQDYNLDVDGWIGVLTWKSLFLVN